MRELDFPPPLDLAGLGYALAHPARAAFACELLGGRLLPAGSLARAARVAASSASEHLAVLLERGIVRVVPVGRHRYYGLASAEIARALEMLGTLTCPPPPRSLRESETRRAERFARVCWDHLAGTLGVALREALLARAWTAARGDSLVLTREGARVLARLGATYLDEGEVCAPCVDVTERRLHTSGRLGRALTSHALASGWLERRESGRALTVTAAGLVAFRETYGVSIDLRDGRAGVMENARA